MGIFTKKTKDTIEGPDIIGTEDEILGTLDEVFKQRIALTVRTKEKRWICNIYSLDIAKRVMRIEESHGITDCNNEPVQCGFALDRAWFVFQSKIVLSSDNKPHLLIPRAIKQMERRKNNRGTFSLREKVSVSILESLGRGVGLTGTAVDISTDGLCLVIDRAIRMENEQKLGIHSGLLDRGTSLAIIKVKGIPGVPSFEAEGIVNRISGPGSWKLAVQFTKLPGSIRSAIEKFVSSRFIAPTLMRRSYQRKMEMQKKREEQRDPEPEKPKKDLPPAQQGGARSSIKFVDENVSLSELTPSPKAKPQPAPAPPAPPLKPWKTPDFKAPAESPESIASDPTEKTEKTEAADQPQPPAPPAKDESLKPVLLSLGDALKDALTFLSDVSEYDWIHIDSPMRIIKCLNERKTGYLMLPVSYKNQSMVEYLEKITHMGVLKEVNVLLFLSEPISPRDMVKCRILGIQHFIILPLEGSDQILDIISPNSPAASAPN
ncbi:MAG: hypothetical protein ACM3SY_19620 [Candidatus Omnitrophota bacterium]